MYVCRELSKNTEQFFLSFVQTRVETMNVMDCNQMQNFKFIELNLLQWTTTGYFGEISTIDWKGREEKTIVQDVKEIEKTKKYKFQDHF